MGEKAFWRSEKTGFVSLPSFGGARHVMVLSWKQGEERLRDCCKHHSVILRSHFLRNGKCLRVRDDGANCGRTQFHTSHIFFTGKKQVKNRYTGYLPSKILRARNTTSAKKKKIFKNVSDSSREPEEKNLNYKLNTYMCLMWKTVMRVSLNLSHLISFLYIRNKEPCSYKTVNKRISVTASVTTAQHIHYNCSCYGNASARAHLVLCCHLLDHWKGPIKSWRASLHK